MGAIGEVADPETPRSTHMIPFSLTFMSDDSSDREPGLQEETQWALC